MDEDKNELEELNSDIDKAGDEIAGDAPKIGWGEILIITPLLMFVDFTEMLGTMAEAVPVVGQVVLLPISLLFSAISLMVTFFVQFYLFIKKIKNLTFLVGSIFDSIPIISGLPLRTAAWLVTVFITNNKKASKLMNATPAGKAINIASKL